MVVLCSVVSPSRYGTKYVTYPSEALMNEGIYGLALQILFLGGAIGKKYSLIVFSRSLNFLEKCTAVKMALPFIL